MRAAYNIYKEVNSIDNSTPYRQTKKTKHFSDVIDFQRHLMVQIGVDTEEDFAKYKLQKEVRGELVIKFKYSQNCGTMTLSNIGLCVVAFHTYKLYTKNPHKRFLMKSLTF